MTEYTLTEAGALIGRSRSTLQNQVRRGALRARLVGKTYVVSEVDLISYATGHRRPPMVVDLKELPPGTYRSRFGRILCDSCGFAFPQHAEDCSRDWTEAELREAYGR